MCTWRLHFAFSFLCLCLAALSPPGWQSDTLQRGRCSSTCLPNNYLLVTAHRSSIMPLTTLWALPRHPATLSPWMCKWIQARLLVIKLLQLVPLVGRFKPACIRIIWVQIAPGLGCLFSFLRCFCGRYISVVSFLYPVVVTPCFRTS